MDYSILVIEQQAILRDDADRTAIADYFNDCKAKNLYPYKAMDRLPWNASREPLKPSKGCRVQLSGFEIALALRVGPERTKAARAAGAKNMIQDSKPGTEREKFIEQNGIAGELAFAKLFNIFPAGQLLVAARKVKDDDGDHTLEDRIIDVKTTEYPSGRLTLATWKNNDTFFDRIHVMSLMTGDIRDEDNRRSGNGPRGSYVWHGFLSSRDLAQPQRLGSLPGRDGREYIARQDELLECLDGWPTSTSCLV